MEVAAEDEIDSGIFEDFHELGEGFDGLASGDFEFE